MITPEAINAITAEHRLRMRYAEPLPRDFEIEHGKNQLILGGRCTGKTSLLYYIMRQLANGGLDSQGFMYVDMTDGRIDISDGKVLREFVDYFRSQSGELTAIFIDNVPPDDERYSHELARLALEGHLLFVTCNDTRIVTDDTIDTGIPDTAFNGLYTVRQLLPLSYVEYLRWHGVNPGVALQKGMLMLAKSLLKKYLLSGGYPDVALTQESLQRAEFTRVRGLIYTSFIEEYAVRSNQSLVKIVRSVADVVGQAASMKYFVRNVLASGLAMKDDTMARFFRQLATGMVVLPVNNYASEKTDAKMRRRYFYYDTGFITGYLTSPGIRLVHNAVALELVRRYGSAVRYYRLLDELDFIIPERKEVIMITESMIGENERANMTKLMTNAAKKLGMQKFTIITYTENDQLAMDRLPSLVQVVSLVRWLLHPEL